ncbi:hypothetical protein Celaphus_00007374 [Cervus elaphus hippelaphus]|uniref:Uncharacterized protein n=1 Tax=Cervus elaphus hippelaphus TaxID=46360 RepID=A0A212CZA6_CEREH|nr:hypothetical protein Celaphus_00007374 [Cervus elaphus hippelaphus]
MLEVLGFRAIGGFPRGARQLAGPALQVRPGTGWGDGHAERSRQGSCLPAGAPHPVPARRRRGCTPACRLLSPGVTLRDTAQLRSEGLCVVNVLYVITRL